MILQKLSPRVKPVKFGKWEVQEFEVSEDNAILFNFKESLHGTTRTITSGKYIKLAHKGCLVMSNTPAELSELSPFEWALKRYAVDDKPKMTTLHRKYGRRCDWQSSWSRDMIRI